MPAIWSRLTRQCLRMMAGTLVLALHPMRQHMPVAKAENLAREATRAAPTVMPGRCSSPWSGMEFATRRLTRCSTPPLLKVVAARLRTTPTPDGTAAQVAVMLGTGRDGGESARTRRNSGTPVRAAVADRMGVCGADGLGSPGPLLQGGTVHAVSGHAATPARSQIRPCIMAAGVMLVSNTGLASTIRISGPAVSHVRPVGIAAPPVVLRRRAAPPTRWQTA
mmetsp:Transcript_11259/g.30647  ORF Transcript_11259/g.30647 Transcript_11259/m.30647 type:complete len:222 (+) Transcript_11259:482-1147(+)